MISFLLNESKDPLSNSEMIEISIPPIDFDRDKYKSLSIFIYHCLDALVLIGIDELDINKKFINLK
jgi:hypothetical protein